MSSPVPMPLVAGYIPGSHLQVVHYRDANEEPLVYSIPLDNGWLHYCNNHEFFLWTHFPGGASLELYKPSEFTFRNINLESPSLYADPVIYPWIIIQNSGLIDAECPGLQQHIKSYLDACAYAATLMDPVIVWERFGASASARDKDMSDFIEEDSMEDDGELDYVEDSDNNSNSESEFRSGNETDEIKANEKLTEATAIMQDSNSPAQHTGPTQAPKSTQTPELTQTPGSTLVPESIQVPELLHAHVPTQTLRPMLATNGEITHLSTKLGATSSTMASTSNTSTQSSSLEATIGHSSSVRPAIPSRKPDVNSSRTKTHTKTRYHPYRAPIPHNTIVWDYTEDGHEIIDLTHLD